MYCPKCGFQLSDDASFCGRCGTDLRGYKKPVPPATDVRSNAATGNAASQGKGIGVQGGVTPGEVNGTGASLLAGVSPNGRRILPLIALALCAIVAVAVFGISRCASDPHASAEALADALEAPMERVFSYDDPEDAGEALGASLIDLMPHQVVSAFEEHGTSREDVAEELGGALGSLSSFMSVLDAFDVDFDLSEGYALDDDYLDNVNEKLQDDMGLDIEVQDACTISASITVTAREDTAMLEKGESQTQSSDATGLVAIQIDGKWYLWTSELNW